MNSKPKTKNRIRLKNSSARYRSQDGQAHDAIALYYPRASASILSLPLLLLAVMFFVSLHVHAFSQLIDLTWATFFSASMFWGVVAWFLFILLPTYALILVTFEHLNNLSFVHKPMLTLTAEGLYHRAFGETEEEFIAWSVIESIWVTAQANDDGRKLYFRMLLKASKSRQSSLVWVELGNVKCEQYTLYRHVLKYWRQYRGDHWQANPYRPETGWS